jgi:hypothetical protein
MSYEGTDCNGSVATNVTISTSFHELEAWDPVYQNAGSSGLVSYFLTFGKELGGFLRQAQECDPGLSCVILAVLAPFRVLTG